MKRIVKSYFLLILALVFSTSLFASTKEENREVEKAYKSWCSAIGTAKGNGDVMVEFYAPNALLLPTFSSKILSNYHGELNAYFADLTKNEDLKCKTDRLVTKVYGDFAVTTGLYTFTYRDNGKSVTVPARFTFVYEKLPEHKWLIVNHHSSVVP